MAHRNKDWATALPPIPLLPGLLAVLSTLGVTAAPQYRVVRESQYHWQFDCRYGDVMPVDVCVYTSHHTVIASLYMVGGTMQGHWVGDIRWDGYRWVVAEMHLDRLLFGR